MYYKILTLGMLIASSGIASGQILFSFEFTGSPSGDGDLNEVTLQPANAQVSALVRNGVQFEPGDNLFNSSGWSISSSQPDADKYIGFTITPNPGFSLNLTGHAFDQQRSSPSYPNQIRVSIFANGSPTPAFTANFVGLPGSSNIGMTYGPIISPTLAGLSSAEYRFYGYNAFDSLDRLAFDNIQALGSITPIPEPLGCSLISGLALALFVVWKRK